MDDDPWTCPETGQDFWTLRCPHVRESVQHVRRVRAHAGGHHGRDQ